MSAPDPRRPEPACVLRGGRVVEGAWPDGSGFVLWGLATRKGIAEADPAGLADAVVYASWDDANAERRWQLCRQFARDLARLDREASARRAVTPGR